MSNLDLALSIKTDVSNIRAGLASVERDLKSLQGTSGNAANRMAGDFKGLENGLQSVKSELVALAGLSSAALALKGVISMADEYKNLEAKLRLVTKSQAEFNDTQAKLTAMANANRQSLSATIDLYSGIAPSLQRVGYSQEKILKAVDSVNKALVVGGSTAVGSSASILQLTQALGSGVLRGDEFNSIMENGRGISMLLADALHTDVGKLRQLAEQGKLTAEVVTQALIDQNDAVSKKFATMPVTVAQALQVVKNNILQAVGDTDSYTGATAALSDVLIFLSENLTTLADIGGVVAALYAGKLLTSSLSYIKAKYDTVVAVQAQTAAEVASTRQAAVVATSNQAVAGWKLKNAQASEAAAAATYNLAKADAAAATSAAEFAATQRLLTLANTRLVESQAAATAATAAYIASTNAATAATSAASAAATTGGVAVRGLSATFSALGGPMGLLMLTVVGLIELNSWLETEQNTIEDSTGKHRDFAEELQRIADLSDGFKGMSRSVQKDIQNKLLDEFKVLKKQQTKALEHINRIRELQDAGGMGAIVLATYTAINGTLDENIAKLKGVSEAIQSLNIKFAENAKTMQQAAGDVPFWDTLEKGVSSTADAVKKLDGVASGGAADWLPAVEKYKSEISAAANQFAIDAKLVQAVMMQESIVAAKKRGVNPETISSPAGAQGLMQLMPGTADQMAKELNITGYSLYNAADNIKLGTAYLSKMLYLHNGDIAKALAAYNAGPGAVKKYGGVPPYKETQTYVTKVMGYLKELSGETKKEEKDAAAEKKRLAKEAADITRDNMQAEVQEYQNNLAQKEKLAVDFAEKMKTLYGADSKEYAAAQRGISDVHRQQATQRVAIDAALSEAKATRELVAIDAEEQSSREREQKGLQTAQQTLQLEQQFEARRYQIKVKALRDKLALEKLDKDKNPVAIAKLNIQLEQLEQQHQLRLGAIKRKWLVQSGKMMTDMIQASTAGIQQSIAGVLSFTTSISDGIRGILQSVLNAAANMLAELAARWITNQLMTLIGVKSTTIGQIGANAAVAGSGAYAATAAIPVIGPALAPAAASAAFAGAMSFASVASAAGGFDIPAGVNPLTQLHEREMVLPAKHADTIRNLEAGAGGAINFHITATDARSVRRLLQNEGGALVDSLKGQARNFRGLKR